ncbi:MAG: DUF3014 domain-containing protein [Xanthomonadales bacterium]|jgi:hypothetical protein|nr:DUF3014 domain-containing protein [Xanthomonadales bacterium]
MNKRFIVIAVIVVLVLGLIAFYWYEAHAPGASTEAETVAETSSQVVARPEPVQETEAPAMEVEEKLPIVTAELEELPLPPLAESDGYARQNLASVVGEAAAMHYFVDESLVARAVASIDALGSRQVPGNIQAIHGPAESYVAVEDPSPPTMIRNEQGDPMPQYLSDPANRARYTAYVEMLETLNAESFAALYSRNYPLFQQAWRELGYVDVDFNDRLEEVIDELLATPEVDEPYRLVKPEAVYLFADEELESLTAGQKILLRMGSENAARVKSSLLKIRKALREM